MGLTQLFTAISVSILLLSTSIFMAADVFAHPLCSDSRAPISLKRALRFCRFNGSACCNSTRDSQLQKQFQAMNISDSGCASIVKSILCAKCDPFSAELFTVDDSSPRQVPLLCNSTVSPNSSQSSQAQQDFCSKVWDTCQSVSIPNSPFSSSLQSLARSFASKTSFCSSFGGSSRNGSLCFSGEPVELNNTGSGSAPTPPAGLCLEKISNGSYLDMVAHPDGSNRTFFASQEGKIFLGIIPKEGSGGIVELDESNPFLDLSDQVHFDSEFGLLGIALHPKFSENGRLFVSFNCDKSSWPGCSGRCACNSDIDCDPSQFPSDRGSQPCQYHSVVAEYTVNDTANQPTLATSAKPTEVRRIFTMGLPFSSHHGGQILFGPDDGYLYLMMGDGGRSGDPYNFAQNKGSLLGKIMRFDVDHFSSAAEASRLGLWGNYSIPKDNPFTAENGSRPEIWALGFRNPWRCSFDSTRPSYFMCADVGQDEYEEVDVITKGGNYGWRVYEGPYLFNATQTPGGNTSANSINPIFPVMGYKHSAVNPKVGSASITGGYFYRSSTDPCLYGRYLYADLYGDALWGGAEHPEDSGNFSISQIPFKCAADSPIQCKAVTEGSPDPALGYVFSFGEDGSRDVYLLASSGVYRVVRPSRCGYACDKENATSATPTGPSSSPSSGAMDLSFQLCGNLVFLLFLLVVGCISGFM